MSADNAGLHLTLDAATLQPLIKQIVRATLDEIGQERDQLADKLVYSEQEAAKLLGVAYHVLRDERQRGRIQCSHIVGRRVRYSRQDLLDYLEGRRGG